MQIIKIDKGFVEVKLTTEEAVLVHNALNEVCHGFDLGDEDEFRTRLGVSMEFAEAMLKATGVLVDAIQ